MSEEKKQNKSSREKTGRLSSKNRKIKKKQKTNSKNKKENKSGLLYLIAIIAAIVIVLFGTLYMTNTIQEKKQESNEWNSFQFQYKESIDAWTVMVELRNRVYEIPFHYHPKELQNITIQSGVENTILMDPPENIIISIPVDSNAQIALAGIEVAKITGSKYNIFNIPTSSAVDSPTGEYPTATCQDANTETVVISFQKGITTNIKNEGRCIILYYAEPKDAIRAADLLSYNMLKIM